MEKPTHIIPMNDSDTHAECKHCKCVPYVENVEGTEIIIHNSFDGREALEWAKEILRKWRK